MKKVLFGAMFILAGIPLIEGIVSLYEQGIQHLCTKLAVKTYKLQETLPKEGGGSQSFAMGFEIPSGADFDEEEEEYEE